MVFLIYPLSSSTLVDIGFWQCAFLYITHGGSTKISSGKESLRGISKSEIPNF